LLYSTLTAGPLGHLQQHPTIIINKKIIAGKHAHGREVVMCPFTIIYDPISEKTFYSSQRFFLAYISGQLSEGSFFMLRGKGKVTAETM
jgi:hypothetical protein